MTICINVSIVSNVLMFNSRKMKRRLRLYVHSFALCDNCFLLLTIRRTSYHNLLNTVFFSPLVFLLLSFKRIVFIISLSLWDGINFKGSSFIKRYPISNNRQDYYNWLKIERCTLYTLKDFLSNHWLTNFSSIFNVYPLENNALIYEST